MKNFDSIINEHGEFFTFEGKQVHANQMAIAAIFSHDESVVFDPEAETYLAYNNTNGMWVELRVPEVKKRLATFVKRKAEANGARAFLRKCNNAFLSAVLQLLQGYTIPADVAALEGLIHVANGMLDFSGKQPKLLPFAPDYFSRRMCAINYKPAAKCPRFLNELLRPVLDAEDVDLLQRYFGAVLLGNNEAQRFLVIHGPAARGKSTVLKAVEAIKGLDQVAYLRTEHLTGRFETDSFVNKSLLVAKDVPCDFLSRKGAQMIKALVGDDLMESERKCGGKSKLRGRFHIVITSNSRLRLAFEDDEAAWRRRLLVIKFGGTLEKQLPNFAGALLRDEAEGILAWMVAGAVNYRENLGRIGSYESSAAQNARIDNLIQESRSAAVFVGSRVVQRKDADVTTEELTQGYVDFCKAKGWQPVTVRQFENSLGDLMLKFHHVVRRNDIRRSLKLLRGFRHVALAAQEDAK